MRARELVPLGLAAAILAITAAWWALALWPLPDGAPDWLARTRWVCFGSAPRGLPNGGGWLLLVAQPLSMFGALMVIWDEALRDGLRALRRTTAGRGALGLTAVAVIGGVAATGVRVARAADAGGLAPAPASPTSSRLDRPAPPLTLVDQTGTTFTLERWRGRPVLVTFAYAHCETVCPLVVQDVLRAQEHTAARRPAVAIVTLDPWRDVPARLPALARQWRIGDDAVVLSGSVDAVTAALAAWNIPITRDPTTGEIAHPALVYVIAPDGRIAYAATGGAEEIAGLVARL